MAASSLPRLLLYASMALAVAGAVLGLVPGASVGAPIALVLSVGLVGYAAWTLGQRKPDPEEAGADEDAFWRTASVNASSLVLLVIFILLALTELLAIPAALGQLVVFSTFGLAFISYYPVVLAILLVALAGAVLLASAQRERPPLTDRQRKVAYSTLGAAGFFLLGALVMATGVLEAVGLKAERSIFVVAAAVVAVFFFVRSWLHLPAYAEVSEWMERDERVKESGILRTLTIVFLAISGLGVVLTLVGATGLAPRPVGLAGAGAAMLALLAATFNVGVSHVVPQLELDPENAGEARKKRKLYLNSMSIGLTVLMAAVGILTFLATLAQAGGVAVFRFLLDAFVSYYLAILALALVPIIAVVYVRTRVRSDVQYTDKMKATALGTATLTLIAGFFGVFIGSGLAEGSGLQIENAVLVMGAALIALAIFVKARTALPGVLGIIKESIKQSENADKSTQEIIKNRMIATYVLGLVFVLSFVGYFVATSLGVVPSPGSSLGTDVGFFVYVLAGIALLVIVVMRYLQSVNIDQRWAAKKKKDETIGKRRLTSAEVKRYLILGFSVGIAVLLFFLGILVYAGVLKGIGPIPLAKKYSTDFFVFAILIGIGPYGWYQSREANRILAIDAKFPEFLRDLAESQRSGMTLTEAVRTAAKGSYGELTPDIRKMAAQIEWGVAFSDALERFAKRVGTPLIKRTVALVIEASNAGGNVVDVLTAAADDSRELQQIVKERKSSMSIYVMIIYIAFAVFVGVIAILNAQFIPEVAKAVEKADGVSIGGLNFKKFDQDDFKTIFFHAAIIQGLGGGVVGGVMAGGKPIHGLKHSFILVLVAWVLFRLVIG